LKDILNSIDESIIKIASEITRLEKNRQSLLESKNILFETNNICPDCMGKGYYYKKSSGGDPYERSSDLQEDCNRCKGTGTYIIQQ